MASGEQIEVTYYLNDVSDDLSQVLMTYNDDGVYDTAYTYGTERIGIDILDNTRPDSQNPLYYLYDGLGSVSYITKPDGEIRDTYKYDEFGKPKTGKLSPDGDKILHTSFGYTGEQWDEESKLQYLRARYYDPEVGRFINRDTYQGETNNPLSKNLYAYVQNNPLNYSDPSGHKLNSYGNFKIGTTDTPRNSQAIKMMKESAATYNIMGKKNWKEWLQVQGIKARAWANVIGGKVPILVDMPQAAANLKHFLENSGSQRRINFGQMISEAPMAYDSLLVDLNLAIDAAEHLSRNGTSVNIVTKSEFSRSVSPEYGYTPNNKINSDWWYAIGLYRTWMKGKVTKKGSSYTMRLEYNMRDFYDWTYGSEKSGGLVTDGEMALLHRYGEAKQYEIVGSVNITVSWKQGQRINSGVHLKISGKGKDR